MESKVQHTPAKLAGDAPTLEPASVSPNRPVSPVGATENKPKSFGALLKLGLCFKPRMHTPFTTAHPRLSRGFRGIINVAVLMAMINFSAFIIDIGSGLPAIVYSLFAVICSFLLGRLLTASMEVCMATSRHVALTVAKYILGITFIFALHVPVLIFQAHMGGEFWVFVCVTLGIVLLDITGWEVLSMLVQVGIISSLQKSESAGKGGKKSVKNLVTPPLYMRAIRS